MSIGLGSVVLLLYCTDCCVVTLTAEDAAADVGDCVCVDDAGGVSEGIIAADAGDCVCVC